MSGVTFRVWMSLFIMAILEKCHVSCLLFVPDLATLGGLVLRSLSVSGGI
jgi:hypothetical protein